MRTLLAVLGSALTIFAAVACGGGDQGSELKGVPWRWSGLLEGGGSIGLSPIPDPENYLLRLDDDGSFIGRADCKSVAGTYSLSGSELTLELGRTTKVACDEDSLSDKYIELLQRVATYAVYKEGSLALGLEDDAGTMYFYAGSA